MPDLRHLRAFLAVAETRNFTRAAAQLQMAQQAVSRSISTLESQLGVELFRRTTHEVELTPAGESLARSGPGALAGIEAAFAEAAQHGRAEVGVIRVGVSPAVGTAAHPRLAEALTAGAPEIHVTFRELRPPQAAEELRRNELDLVISRAAPGSGEFGSAQLPPSPAVVIVGEGHRLAGRDRIAVADLDGERLQMWSAPGEQYADELLARLAGHGVTVETSVAQVQGGGGPPVLDHTEFALRPQGWPAPDHLRLALGPPGLDLPLWVLWASGRPHPAVARLREHLAATA